MTTNKHRYIYFKIHILIYIYMWNSCFAYKREIEELSTWTMIQSTWIIDLKWPWRKRKACNWHVPSSKFTSLFLYSTLFNQSKVYTHIYTKLIRCTYVDNTYTIFWNFSIFFLSFIRFWLWLSILHLCPCLVLLLNFTFVSFPFLLLHCDQ